MKADEQSSAPLEALRDLTQLACAASTVQGSEIFRRLLQQLVALCAAQAGALLLLPQQEQHARDIQSESLQVETDIGNTPARPLALYEITSAECQKALIDLSVAETSHSGSGMYWLKTIISCADVMAEPQSAWLVLGWGGKSDASAARRRAVSLLHDVSDAVAIVVMMALQRDQILRQESVLASNAIQIREQRIEIENWERIFDAISDPIGVLTPDYRIVHANIAYKELSAATTERLHAEHYCFTIRDKHQEPCSGCPLPETLRTKRPHFVQQEVITAYSTDGEPEQRTYQRWTYPVMSAAGAVEQVVELVKDMTEQEQLRQAESQQRVQHETDQLRAELLGTVSHELRSPLTSIKGYSETLLRHERRLSPAERHEFLQAITTASARMEVLIDRLLELSQLNAGTLALHPSPINIWQLAREVALAADQRVREQQSGIPHIQFALSSAGKSRQTDPISSKDAELFWPLGNGNQRLLRDVLDHLIDNAIKYTPSMDGRIEVLVGVTEKEASAANVEGGAEQLQQPMIEIVVRDNGIGIAPEQIPHIFEQFHRVDTRLTREVAGLGIGLALCKRIIALHGGTIWVESRLGEGSAFHVLLPQLELNGVDSDGTSDTITNASTVARREGADSASDIHSMIGE